MKKLAPFIFGLTIACFDIGRPPPPPEDAAVAIVDLGSTSPGDCVEGAVAPDSPGKQVRIGSFTMDPVSLLVRVGDVVVWTNGDAMDHEIVAGAPGAPLPLGSGGFTSGILTSGGRYAHRFCRPRQLLYFCANHPGLMNGYQLGVE